MQVVSEKPGHTEPHSKSLPSDLPTDDGVSLYVHTPFCVSKCRYCDFNSYALTSQSIDDYVDALLSEARDRIQQLRPQSVFIGGGTPSLLSPVTLKRLLDGLDDICGFRASSFETTMEANPESLDAATAEAAFSGGVNRLSIGVQSLRPDVLRAYDRVHSPEQALESFSIARSAGFKRINLDLIYAFPGQSTEAWVKDLTAIHELKPEHLSCYELSYEPGTALTRLRDAGRWQSTGQDECADLFTLTRHLNDAVGFEAYEVSAFARPGESSLHNLGYWRSLEYVGIGAGAAGWKNGIRRRNIADPEQYAVAIAQGKDPVGESERPEPRVVLFDHLMMGLRLSKEGVLLSRARRATGLDPMLEYEVQISEACEQGMLEVVASGDGERLRTTSRGLLLLDDILTRFLPDGPDMSV